MITCHTLRKQFGSANVVVWRTRRVPFLIRNVIDTGSSSCFRRISLFTLDWGDLEPGSGASEVDHHEGTRPILESLAELLKGVAESKTSARNGTDDGDGFSVLGPTQQWIENPDLENQNWTVTSDSNGTSRPRFFADPKLPLCPMIPPGLHGTIKTITNEVPNTMEEIEGLFPYLSPGGRYRPGECNSRHRVAIIVPYRDREDHLRTFLLNIHKFLQPQQLDYAIYLGKPRPPAVTVTCRNQSMPKNK